MHASDSDNQDVETDDLEEEYFDTSGWQLNVFKFFWENGTMCFSFLEFMNFWNNHTFVMIDVWIGGAGLKVNFLDYAKGAEDKGLGEVMVEMTVMEEIKVLQEKCERTSPATEGWRVTKPKRMTL
jgi:hypothetical protein